MKQIILIVAIFLFAGCISKDEQYKDLAEDEVIYEEILDSIIETDADVKHLHPELSNQK
ncbi:MAG: hypothetical protein IJ698_10390 [Prevotella sp.]|nr:hypothetical protein [Prevotella sp.]MBR1656793.1 hypothetical protein [Prevotella sp.]